MRKNKITIVNNNKTVMKEFVIFLLTIQRVYFKMMNHDEKILVYINPHTF